MDDLQPANDLNGVLESTFDVFREVLSKHRIDLTSVETGHVQSVGRGVAIISGLPGARSEELLQFSDGSQGLVFNLDEEEVGVVLLDSDDTLTAGSEVQRTGRILDVPVGDELLGRVIDPAGRPLDQRGPIQSSLRRACEHDAPAIIDRLPVTVPLQTGLKVIDTLVPVGRGQRELILGDRQTGKTTIAVDTILNQDDVISVYCAIGQRTTAVARVVETLRSAGALERCVVVAASADSTPGQQYIAPYAATAIAEYFMEQGRDTLVVYDDLTAHARAYRELSLLLRRPPGREAFPGDIFYLHSRLLERATHLCEGLGGGSLTALPIAETEAQNVAAYIPTNLISITDGQIYLSPDLFQKGVLPAVDAGRSVSRVGGKTQLRAYRSVAGSLRLSYAQFEELEAFSRFSSRLDEATQATLTRGRRIREVFRQMQGQPLSVARQICSLIAVTQGVFDGIALQNIARAERLSQDAALAEVPKFTEACENNSEIDEAMVTAVTKVVRAATASLETSQGESQP